MKKGSKHSPATLRKMSERMKGKRHPMWGRAHTKKARAQISYSLRKRAEAKRAAARLTSAAEVLVIG